jgi:hypothetical protein
MSSPSPAGNRSRKSFPNLGVGMSSQAQGQGQGQPPVGRGGSYVTPPMANGRRMTSNPVSLPSSANVDA